MVGTMTMRADEINCLIYAYLRDSGLNHTAFALFSEAQLEGTPNSQKHIPHGELVDLLGKALLFVEVEKHWAGNNAMVTNCTAPFSLLEEHVCDIDPTLKPTATLESALEADSSKRKATDDLNNGHTVKKTKAGPPAGATNANEQAKTSDVAPKVTPKPQPSEPPKPATFSPSVIGASGEAVQVIPCRGSKELFCVAVHPHEPQIISAGSRDGTVNIKNVPLSGPALDPSHDKVIKIAGDTDGDITSMDWSPDGRLLSVACFDHKVRLLTKEGILYLEGSAHTSAVFSAKFSKDGKWLVSAGLDRTTCVWNIPEKKLHKQVEHGGCCLDLEWLSSDIYAVCCSDSKVHVVHLDGTASFASLVGHTSEVNSIKYNAKTNRLASCSDDSTARVWAVGNLNTTAATQQTVEIKDSIVLRGHAAPVNNTGWAGPVDAEIIITSSFDRTSRIWDANTGACLKTFSDHTKAIFAISLSPDNRFFATAGNDGWLHVYNIPRSERVWSWRHEIPRAHGVFDVTWRIDEPAKINRFAVVLESGEICVMNGNLIPLQAGTPVSHGKKLDKGWN